VIPLHRVEQAIPDLIFLVVITTTISSFALSFVNLQDAALEAGINSWLAFLWPICIDAVLVAGSLMILRSSLRNEPAGIGWLVLLGFTAISTGFNIVHSPEEITSRLAHAVPPISLCVSIEILMLIIRSDLKGSVSVPVHDAEPEPSQTVHENLGDDTHEPCTSNARTISDEEIIQVFREKPDITLTAAAETLGCHRSTVSRRLSALKESGLFVIPDYPISTQ